MDYKVFVEITVDAGSYGDAVDIVESVFEGDDGIGYGILEVREA